MLTTQPNKYYLQRVSFLVVLWAFAACVLSNWGSGFLNLHAFFSICSALSSLGQRIIIWMNDSGTCCHLLVVLVSYLENHFINNVLTCPYYGLWKVHILVLGVPNNRLTCMQSKITLSFSYNMHLYLICSTTSKTIRSTIHFSKPILCVMLICSDWLVSLKAVLVGF